DLPWHACQIVFDPCAFGVLVPLRVTVLDVQPDAARLGGAEPCLARVGDPVSLPAQARAELHRALVGTRRARAARLEREPVVGQMRHADAAAHLMAEAVTPAAVVVAGAPPLP